jgi:hypothetical protein
MRTGSAQMWALAEECQVIPHPPDRVLSTMLSSWWSTGRIFGCVTARSSAWFIVMPTPELWCGSCAGERFATERRCAYCARPVRLSKADTLVYEMADITILGRGHRHCAERARKESRS